MNELIARAAQARAAAVQSRADRPSERRASDVPGVFQSRAVTKHPIQFRDSASGGGLDFIGYASVTERSYQMWDWYGPYEEIVTRGAFEDTLAQANLDVPLVLNHDSLRRIARTTNGSLLLEEDDIGLRVEAPNLDPADQDVAYIAPKLRAGLIDEMSFRFSITSGQWSPDYTEFRINAADIHRGDVAIVGYGASPHTSAQLRSLQQSLRAKLQVGRALDAEDVNMLTQALAWFTSVDNIVDKAQMSLAEYLQVPNPDDDEPDADVGGMASLSAEALTLQLRTVRDEFRRRGLQEPMTLRELLSA